MAAKEVAEAKEADEKARKDEMRELKKEKKEEKVEDKGFAAMQAQLKKDVARAESNPDQPAGVSRLYFDKEMLAMNERVHAISTRVEELSQRVHEMAQRVENIPEQLAELKLELTKAEVNIRSSASGPASRPKAPMQAATRSGSAFWGIQIGAYKTRAGAEVAWAEFLADPMAVELNDAKVHYIQSKPLRNGSRLTLMIINDYASRKAAEDACNTMKGRGIDCVAYHVKP
ncbi:MAG: SPOR domain-containing protein [Alphaproteobacteria bacterium]|nr:SPOR domain-containing protein [Alphaproteobacteria bacterium]MBL6952828.1 SPOR domain-containing protein [Alphaproteobacteria bacterium]